MKAHIILLILVFLWAIFNRTSGIVKALKGKDDSKLKVELFFTVLVIMVFVGVLWMEEYFQN